ncbi:MAG: HEAT repeat domain-containing protein [Planctomycetota bacterium]|nr:HEAT repeat domain-containing protein [Planctomycetota bacterium]
MRVDFDRRAQSIVYDVGRMFTAFCALAAFAEITTGTWSARLDTAAGPLNFQLDIERGASGPTAVVVNGVERIDVPLTIDDANVVFEFPHYAAKLTARFDATGKTLVGEWSKRAGPDTQRTLPFHAVWTPKYSREAVVTAPDRLPDVSGRWRVTFAKDPDPAVAIFTGGPATRGAVDGTFLTSTGDYRYLAGTYDENLRIGCFDGAHAFLFVADLKADGSLAGTFTSGSTWTDTWTAVRDDAAQLPNEFERVQWDASYTPGSLAFEDVDGQHVSLGDARFEDRPLVLQITGSWCPNCHDETELLAELDRTYRAKGLAIAALCFELTGERRTDAEAAKRMLARHRADYPALLVGRSDKNLAREALPALSRVFAFPTTVFLHRDGRVRAVHTGFSGPATGAAHVKLRAEFLRLIEELLAEKSEPKTEMRDHVLREMWRNEVERTFTTFTRGEKDALSFQTLEMTRFDGPTRMDPVAEGAMTFTNTTLRLGERAWIYDELAHVMLDANNCGSRMTPAARSPFPVVAGVGYAEFALILAGLSSGDPIRRRESAYYAALQIVTDRMTPPEYGGGQIPAGTETNLTPLLNDADPRVRATASWAAGVTGLSAGVEALTKNLEHGHAAVRRESARALGMLDAKAAAKKLALLAEHDIDPLVRAAAQR